MYPAQVYFLIVIFICQTYLVIELVRSKRDYGVDCKNYKSEAWELFPLVN